VHVPPSQLQKLAFVSGLGGFAPPTSTGSLPLDPAGGLPSPDHLFCPPVANSWLRPCINDASDSLARKKHNVGVPIDDVYSIVAPTLLQRPMNVSRPAIRISHVPGHGVQVSETAIKDHTRRC